MRTSSFRLALTWGLAALASSALVGASPAGLSSRQSSDQGFTDPTTNGGSLLTTGSSGLGEPINVIISAASSKEVLTPDGLAEYLRSLYFSPGSCLGQSLGTPQQANLGDGRGATDQQGIVRFNYYSGDGGSCVQSLRGGNHARYWTQSGSGAIFLATSVEGPASTNHDIVDNGYDLGRDLLVNNATNSSGTTSPGGFKYSATSTQLPLLSSVQQGQINHDIAIDGNVAVLTVTVTKSGTVGASSAAAASATALNGGSSDARKGAVVGTQSSALLLVAASIAVAAGFAHLVVVA